MDQSLTTTRKQFNEAVKEFGLDAEAAESIWSYASSVGMRIDDFTLSILLYGARQEKTARDAEGRMRSILKDFARSVEEMKAAATKDIEARGTEIMSNVLTTMSAEARNALAVAVEKVADSRIDEVRAYQSRSNWSVALACVVGILIASVVIRADGYVSGRDSAVLAASEFSELAKNPKAAEWLSIARFNTGNLSHYCGRGSSTLEVIDGRTACTLKVWLSGQGPSIAKHTRGGLRETFAFIENWMATASWWLLLSVGAVGALILRKALRRFAMLGPVRWLLDLPSA